MSTEGKSVFLTGGSGFIASHILSLLIKNGYKPIASVRSPSKVNQILKLHPEWVGKVRFVFVPEITTPGAFDHVLRDQAEKGGFDYIIHTASPVTFSVEDVKKDLIDPAVHGTTEILRATHELGGKQVKRFVLLGSAVSVLDSFEDLSAPEGKPYSEDDWNPATEHDAVSSQSPLIGYNVGKKNAELAAWHFMKETEPSFELVVINPDVVIGPMLQPVPSPKNVNETNEFACYAFINGTHRAVGDAMFAFWDFVDVRDVALLHVIALTSPHMANKRHIISSGPLSPQLVVNIIRKNFPELEGRLPRGGDENEVFPKGLRPTPLNNARSLEIIRQAKGWGWNFKTLEESIVGSVRSLLELEQKWGSQAAH
ncbi:hypothetical protein BCIN_12g05340 [Botrytis cinerea B05.10]|uniref:NAD-dependent epimerase/dehydratase domain-containing protein n=1 Tax=Botryotinia fuckeliana (strain B05.10) TaxID=332648 RepID=A0A384JZP7_BOTFB|nr:hypothetical protein BCIN_12g05340 [Botrytis cinerea B05.10]ATZ55992.1 hypothetical protein BCIN_12g05340 [Botrytis cinerea B05.10]